MLKVIISALFLISTPAFGSGIVIDVRGESNGSLTIDLFEEIAPQHTNRILKLAEEGFYNGVVFHRVIEGFMAQTGDGQFGKVSQDRRRAGMGGSDYANLTAEFSDINYDRGIVGMARSQDPDSANSQFFIMFAEGSFLNGQYTVIGKVTDGLDVLDKIKKGLGPNGVVLGEPDFMDTVSGF